MPNVLSVLLLLCCVIIIILIIQHTLQACGLVTLRVAVVNGNYFQAAGRLQTLAANYCEKSYVSIRFKVHIFVTTPFVVLLKAPKDRPEGRSKASGAFLDKVSFMQICVNRL